MNELFKNQAFRNGFFGGVVVFFLINYLCYLKSYNAFLEHFEGKCKGPCFSIASYSIGFPFDFYRVVIANPNSTFVDRFSFALDVLIAFTCSFLVGLIFKKYLDRSSN